MRFSLVPPTLSLGPQALRDKARTPKLPRTGYRHQAGGVRGGAARSQWAPASLHDSFLVSVHSGLSALAQRPLGGCNTGWPLAHWDSADKN